MRTISTLLDWNKVPSGELGDRVAMVLTERDALRAANRDCLLHFETLKADYDALRAKLDQFAKWIINHPSENGDHACAQCYPFSDLLKDGFVCAYHAAELIARPRKEGE